MADKAIRLASFAGMGDNGLFWLEGARIAKVNGKDVISPRYDNATFIDATDTGFTSLSSPINAFSSFAYGGSAELDILGIEKGNIFLFDPVVSGNHQGRIHELANSGSGTDQIADSNSAGIVTTENENILYTSANHLGLGYKLTANSATSTSMTVSSPAFDFTAKGISTSAGSNKVFNLDSGEEYTITSISGGSNDTINFAAPSTTPQAGDEFIVFADDKFKFNTELTVGQQFGNQDVSSNWQRQVILWEGSYYALNGNYLAKLDNDESTFSDTDQQFTVNMQGRCMATNGSWMLIGGEIRSNGQLLLWDGSLGGWNNKVELSKPVDAIAPFKSGFLVLAGGKLYFTNGYTLELYAQIPDTINSDETNTGFDGMKVINDVVYVSSSDSNRDRFRSGIYAHDGRGFTYIPLSVGSERAYLGTGGALAFIDDRIFYSNKVDDTTGSVSINRLSDSGTKNWNFIYYVDLQSDIGRQVSRIGLNLVPKMTELDQGAGNVDITVNIGDGSIPIWRQGQVKSGSSSTFINNNLGATRPATVGQEFVMSEDDVAGERSYIQSITFPGTSNEQWSISPALSATPADGTEIQLIGVKLIEETRTLDAQDITEEQRFDLNEFGNFDKIFIEVVVKSSSNQEVELTGINLY